MFPTAEWVPFVSHWFFEFGDVCKSPGVIASPPPIPHFLLAITLVAEATAISRDARICKLAVFGRRSGKPRGVVAVSFSSPGRPLSRARSIF